MRTLPEPMDLLPAFERSADGVYAVDHDQNIVFWNRMAERLLGFKAADVLHRKCFDVIAGGDHHGHPFCGSDCPVIDCARHGRPHENYDVRTRTAGGKVRWINISIVVLMGRRRRSVLTVHLARDVTEKRRQELRTRAALRDAPRSASAMNADGALARLTRREMEVLELLASGHTTPRIANVLGVSTTTVRNHVEHLLGKLGVHSRLEAVAYAAQHWLV
jgi:PAS domain S-box-containing protein